MTERGLNRNPVPVATPELFTVENLECGYETFRLREITFTVQRGEFAGIIGPNGSGKTSLLRALTGTLPLREGRVLFEGEEFSRISNRKMALKMAVVSQTPVAAQIPAEDYIMLGRIPHRRPFQFFDSGADVAAVRRAVEMTGTEAHRGKWVHELSGGERQLVMIARALAQEPEVILLDEPTTYLDITHQVRVMDLLKRLNRENGLTVITVLHDLNLAGEYCNRLLLMNEGRLFADGDPEGVLTYQTIEKVYKTVVVVGKSPFSSRPYIYLVSEAGRVIH